MENIRWFALAVLVVFSVYSLYVTWKENFWKSIKAILKLHWGRQVVADLFVGLALFAFFVFMNEPSPLVAGAWVTASFIFGNPVTLLYFVLNFESLAAHFA
jgi:hypothetical protein